MDTVLLKLQYELTKRKEGSNWGKCAYTNIVLLYSAILGVFSSFFFVLRLCGLYGTREKETHCPRRSVHAHSDRGAVCHFALT